MSRFLLANVCVLAIWTASLSANAADHLPFIAGFDRFGKHQEIDEWQSGILLVRELSCTACHSSENPSLVAKGGPLLDDVAHRLQLDWVERFLMAPHQVKPGTTMPDVLALYVPAERAKIAHAITAFLSTRDTPLPEIKGSGLVPVPNEFWNIADVEVGDQLYHRVGCVACHQVLKDSGQDKPVAASASALDTLLDQLEPEQLKEMGLTSAARVVASDPMAALNEKYTRRGLTLFLLDPLRSRPAGRMPNLKLAPVEAANIVGFLLQSESSINSSLSTADSSRRFTDEEISQGRRWFTTLNCVNCHISKEFKKSDQAIAFSQLNWESPKGCLGTGQTRSIQFGLSQDQVRSLQLVVRDLKDVAEKSNPNPEQQLLENMLSFNCFACHTRDGMGGVGRFRRDHFATVGNIDLGDEGRFPPPLDHVGRKLQTNWLKNVLLGKKADIRPHLQIRMPIFPTELSQKLPSILATVDEHAKQPQESTVSKTAVASQELAEVGRQLMDTGCVQCHAFSGNTLPGVIGVDLQAIDSRIQPKWFQEFLADPGRLKTRTRMPNFFPDGKSQRPDLLDGNVDAQIAAMWAYLSLNSPRMPSKIQETRDRDYELKPTDKPIVLRTFMKQAGTHTIAVGFPEKVHYAFDAERSRLAIGWHGKFMDAQATWFVRIAPLTEPLGESIVQLSDSVPFAKIESPDQPWPSDSAGYRFKGYRLDSVGIPTMLYQLDQVSIEDRIDATEEGGLRRHWKLSLPDSTSQSVRMSWLVHAASKLNVVKKNAVLDEQKLTVTLVPQGPQAVDLTAGRIHVNTHRQEWIVPIDIKQSIELEVEYRW
jgi:mono/diheme cytochrome c family protein